MKLQRYEDASQFYQQVKDYLLNQEAMHNLLLGIANTLIYHPETYDSKPYLAAVEKDREIVCVAIRTPPYDLLLSKIQDFGAVEVIAQDLHQSCTSLVGVNAPNDEALAFARMWQKLTRQSYHLKMALRTFKLEQVQPIYQATGNLRVATVDDKELLKRWYQAFRLEVDVAVVFDAENWVEKKLQQGTAFIWEDNKVSVSMACRAGLTPNGVGINGVYTPSEYRKKGYASSCVAALSQVLLNQGHKYCFLFTDLANPTSNHIYQQIGYEAVGDWNNYCFIN